MAEAKDAIDEICAKHYMERGGNDSGTGYPIIVLIGISLTLDAFALIYIVSPQ